MISLLCDYIKPFIRKRQKLLRHCAKKDKFSFYVSFHSVFITVMKHNHKYSTILCVYVKSVPTPLVASNIDGELEIKFQNSGRVCYGK
jgi:hypothetical protein